MLLDRKNGDVNLGGDYGAIALAGAAENGHGGIVKLLLEYQEVDVNLKEEYGSTALAGAARNGHEAIVKLLLTRVASGKPEVP